MNEIRVLIADDEPLARRGVAQLLEPHGDMRIVGQAGDGGEAVRLIEALRPDLLFLDVEMPENDGFGVLARSRRERRPAVVFLTAYEEYAVEAFDAQAVDYLVKPPTRQRFERALSRVREYLRLHPAEEQGAPAEHVVVDHRGGAQLLRPEEIDWVEAADYYAAVHAHGQRFLLRESLDSLEARLPAPPFLRVHRSALVNMTRMRRLARGDGGGTLVLASGAEVPVSRRRRAAVREWLGR